jgi:hypothetical protein
MYNMKKIFTLLCLLALFVASNGQTQRLIVIEEFTNASCGPCASQNPDFDALLQANPTKLTAIKYHTDWPGVDPMNAQTAAQVDARVTYYYQVNGVPTAMYDGVYDSTFVDYEGCPADFTQALIDAQYALPSPFSMTVTHNLSADYDSIFISVTITAAQAVSVGDLKLQVILVEDLIQFDFAPGTNGETDFYNVMRLMIPDDQGTAITNTWTNGQSQNFQFDVAVPSYIYNLGTLSVVAFIQDNNNKRIKQGAHSAAIPLEIDAGVTAITNVPAVPQCDNSPFTPSCTIKNYGTATLTTCTVNYKIDNGTVQQVTWNGSLATGATANVTLNPITPTGGSHTLAVYTSDPNGLPDYATTNDKKTVNLWFASIFAPTPMSEGFEGTFPPNNWYIDNPDGGYTWEKYANAGSAGSTSSMRIYNYLNPEGEIDDAFITPLDLSTPGYAAYTMTFDVAHGTYSGYYDRLQVQVSSDCGTNWSTPYDKSDPALATAPASTTAYVPTASQWRTETVNLNSFAGQSQVLVRFRSISGYSNNLYIDNISLTGSIGINENAIAEKIKVYPNPFDNNATVEFTISKTSQVKLNMYNSLGEIVYTLDQNQYTTGTHILTIDGSGFAAGLYNISLTVDNNNTSIPVSVIK